MDIHFAIAETFHKITDFGNDDFPVEVHLEELKNTSSNSRRPHFHEVIQFMVGCERTTIVTINRHQYLIGPNEGIFINANAAHEEKPADGIYSSYICIMMHPKMIYGLNNSMFRRYYVTPILDSDKIDAIPFNDGIAWHRNVIDLLKQIDVVNKAKEFTYMLTTQRLLIEIWTLILTNNTNRLRTTASVAMSFVDQERIDRMMNFIVEKYNEKINLSMIANIGGISNSECCRLFKRTANISPMQYVNNTRLLEASRLLSTTNLSVTDVSYETGFSNPSYFSEQFQKFMNCTPLKYRKNHFEKKTKSRSNN